MVKDSISKLIHFSNNAQKFLNSLIDKNKEKLSLPEVESIKNIDEFFNGLKQCTIENLINSLDLKTPLLFFKKHFEKENIKNSIESLFIKTENNKDSEQKDFHSKLENLNKQIEEINKNENYFKDIKDFKLIEEFKEKTEYIKNKNNIVQKIDNMEEIKKTINKGIWIALEYKKSIKTKYFIFKDFTRLYLEYNTTIKKFDPYVICKNLLSNCLKDDAKFYQSDDARLEELLKK